MTFIYFLKKNLIRFIMFSSIFLNFANLKKRWIYKRRFWNDIIIAYIFFIMFVKRINFIFVILNFFRNSRFSFYKDVIFFFFSYLFIIIFNDFIYLTNFISSFSFKTINFLFYSIDKSNEIYYWNCFNKKVNSIKKEYMFIFFDKEVNSIKEEYIFIFFEYYYNKEISSIKKKCIFIFFEYI